MIFTIIAGFIIINVILICAAHCISNQNQDNGDAKAVIRTSCILVCMFCTIWGICNIFTDFQFTIFINIIGLIISIYNVISMLHLSKSKKSKQKFVNSNFKQLAKCSNNLFYNEDTPSRIYIVYSEWLKTNNKAKIKHLKLTAKTENELAWLLAFLDSNVANDYAESPEICDRIFNDFKLFINEIEQTPAIDSTNDNNDYKKRELKRWARQ